MIDGGKGYLKRGITCSSFTSVSINPPIISFCMKIPSRMHNLLQETKQFAVHVLNQNQVKYGLHFSKPVQDDINQFHLVPHELTPQGIPVICGAAGVLHCMAHSVHNVGDHAVWYGSVTQTNVHQSDIHPLLYFKRSFRSVGDEAFMNAFEERTLPFEDWTHEAHLRMAWNYIMKYGEQAEPYIKNGIQRYNEQNKHLISTGYHETVTKFYIHMVTYAINISSNPDITFEEFLTEHPYLTDRNLLFEYYTKECISSKHAANEFMEPDIQQLP
ncbi:unnamed protein product [Owenia fusiformis]|nr:unnamed protein product [Owenia fusiformis]